MVLKYISKTASMSKILRYLEAFSTQLEHIFQCVGWKVRGGGWRQEDKIHKLPALSTLQPNDTRELETLYKLQLPSHCRMPKKRAETISASL